jgi:enterochelin esterase-like enzyme
MTRLTTYAIGLAIAGAAIVALAQTPSQPGPPGAFGGSGRGGRGGSGRGGGRGGSGRGGGGNVAPPAGMQPNSQYRLGPDSMPQDGVPKGEIQGPFHIQSNVYPGTQHTYWVYVPAQYDPAIPTALMVYQDGQAFKDPNGDLRAQNVMDNLIYRREIPVMLGVFINPGRTPEQPEPPSANGDWGDQTTNRPTEYNTPDDKYARVVTEELMPALNKAYNISKDPEMRGIGGSSSGAIAAFMVAWERPNEFRKVLSNVGSFTDIRGGYVYPERVAAAEKKPIRVFLCDGRNDNRNANPNRDWFLQNVRLKNALVAKGYDVNWDFGMNLHGQKFGGVVMPDMMRWLWRDAQPISTDPNDMTERGFREAAKK